MLTIIADVVARRLVVPGQLGWLSGRRAETRPNFPANRDYLDLRGLTPAALDVVLEEERAGYEQLAAADYTVAAIAAVERRRARSTVVPELDFGIASTVVGLSAFGCVPVMSCRGRSLGADGHQFPAPMATFYARKTMVPVLLAACETAEINIVNSGAKLEVYSEDLRKMHRFACALRESIARDGAMLAT